MAICTLALPTSVGAQSGSRQSAELRFTQQQPAVPSALIFNADYVNPDDPGAKPPPVRMVVETLAAGARIDTAVPELCTATDAQLMAQGADACPPGSRVGAGTLRIDSGFPEPARFIDADVVFLNNTDELIFVSTERDSGARVVTRSMVQGGQITNSAPPLPGTPPDGGAIDVVRVELGDQTRRYITTPLDCPPSGRWTNSIAFTYADGVTQTVLSDSPCLSAGSAAAGATEGRCALIVNGTRKRDRLVGTAAGELIRGFRGRDRIVGGGGIDCLQGKKGRDRLNAGDSGPDLVRCGRGRDWALVDPSDRVRGCERVKRKG